MAERAIERESTPWLRRIFAGLAVLVLLVIVFAAFLFGTSPGGRLALSLAARLLPQDVEVHVDAFSGRLIDRFELRGVDLRLPAAAVAVSRVTVDWQGGGLLRRRVHVDEATVEGVVVRLDGTADSSATVDKATPDSPPGRPIPELPVHISFDSVAVTDIAVQWKDSTWISAASVAMTGELDDYGLSFSGLADVPDLASGEVVLSGRGSTEDFQLDSLAVHTMGGRVSASGALSWWPEVGWDGVVEADHLEPSHILPDSTEWPGWISLSGSSSGQVSGAGELQFHAAVDTVFGDVRGEQLGGRFEVRLHGTDFELSAARFTWGGAAVNASGTAGQMLDLEFAATVPDFGLLLAGSAGRAVGRGRATGPRKTPRIQGSFEAGSVELETVGASWVEGQVDLDLAGPLGATVFARNLSIRDRGFDSARVVLSGRRTAHRLAVSARGSDHELDLEAVGSLDPENAWDGTIEAFRLTADTVGSWALAAPVAIFVSPDVVRLAEACLVSAPARVCAAGETGGSRTRVTAIVDSLQVERLAPLMPDNVYAEAMLQAAIAFEVDPRGRLSGEVEVRASAGVLTLPVHEKPRDLYFEPIELTVSSGQDGTRGAIDLHVADPTGVRLLDIVARVESPVAIRSSGDLARLRRQPGSAHLEVEADDLRLLTDDLVPGWDVSGSLQVAADVAIDAQRRLTGSVVAESNPLVLRNTAPGGSGVPMDISADATVRAALAFEVDPAGEVTGDVEVQSSAGHLTLPVRGESRHLVFAPIDVVASTGQDGMRVAGDLLVTDSTGVRLLDIVARVESPSAIRSTADLARLWGQPGSVHLEVEADDLLLLVGDLLPLWDVSGSLQAVADLDVDAEGRLTGDLAGATDSLVLRNTVRGQGWTLFVDPARMGATVGSDGLHGQVEFAVSVPGQREIFTASGQISLPNLTTLDIDPEDQPVDGSLDVQVADMSLAEAFLVRIADARGTFELRSRVGGTLADLTVDGEANLADGYALVPALGLQLTDIAFSAAGRPDGTVEVDGSVRSGEGSLSLSGRSQRYPSTESPTVIQVRGERFLLIDVPEVNLAADPMLDLVFDGHTVRLTGDVLIPRGRLGFPDIPPSAVTPSEDVRFVGDSAVVKEPPVPFGTDITVTLGDDVFFNGFGFASNLIGNVRIQQEPDGQASGRGEVSFVNGTYRTLGQELRIDPGRLLFNGPIDDPGVDARAFVRASDGTEAGFRIGGTVQNLSVSTYSVPPKSESDVMAYILFGRPMNQTSGTEGNQASNAAAVLGANMLTMSLAPSLGLDEARIETGSSQNKAQLVVGKYVSPRLYVGYGVGIYAPISTLRLRYLLSARWSIEAITGDQQSTDLLWRIERGEPKPEEATREEGSPEGGSDSEAEVQ